MNRKKAEFLTGVGIGLLLALAFTVKVVAAPVSEEETEMISRIVELESGNQCLEGRRMVAAVILNRCDHEQFPDTVEEVISEPGQFQTYKHIEETDPSWKSDLAVKMELESRSNSEVVFFRTEHYGMGAPAMRIQDHYFSKIK